MKTITIQVQVPDDFSELNAASLADDAARLASDDWLAVWWHIDDVLQCAGDSRQDYEGLTKEEAHEVLELASDCHNPEIGINWDALRVYIDEVVREREEIA
jgi:hypothetical protein